MIAQGTDGVSRVFLLGQGVMNGDATSAFVPIHLSAIERLAQNLVPWIRGWAGKEAILLAEWDDSRRGTMWKDGRREVMDLVLPN
jgi:hypothetical protein